MTLTGVTPDFTADDECTRPARVGPMSEFAFAMLSLERLDRATVSSIRRELEEFAWGMVARVTAMDRSGGARGEIPLDTDDPSR